jgi:RNA polymerase sigma-70 factor (ECF subfamily)
MPLASRIVAPASRGGERGLLWSRIHAPGKASHGSNRQVVVTKSHSTNHEEVETRAAREGAEYAALVRAVQAGDKHAMEKLLMRAQEVAYRFSLLVCGRADDADDAMQEALLKTYRYAARIREPEAFRAWLYRTVRNACLIGRRKRANEPDHLVSLDDTAADADGREHHVDAVDSGRNPEDQAINSSLRSRLLRSLAAVPRPYRVVVVLREIEGLSTREVAKVMGISEANVKTRLHRARLLLREHLEAS